MVGVRVGVRVRVGVTARVGVRVRVRVRVGVWRAGLESSAPGSMIASLVRLILT